jgi:hypothetical protein
LNVSIVPEIPSYFTGFYTAAGTSGDFSPAMLPIAGDYVSNKPITSGVQGCEGSCTVRVRAPALLPRSCVSTVSQYNLSAPDAPGNLIVFDSSLTPIYGTTEMLDFKTELTGDGFAEMCAGPKNTTHCYLQSAIAEYDALIVNGTIKLENAAHPRLVSWANNTAITNETISKFHLRDGSGSDWTKTTLGGIVYAFELGFHVSATAILPPSNPRWPPQVQWNYVWFLYQHITNYEQADTGKACSYTWADPRSSVMAGLNELMFRTGVYLAEQKTFIDNATAIKDFLDPGLVTDYTVVGTLQKTQAVFKSDYPYFYGGATFELLVILFVASTFYGCWRLARPVSWCPLEMAKVSEYLAGSWNC